MTDQLYINEETTREEVNEFMLKRSQRPTLLRNGDIWVFNYHNEPLEVQALSEWADDAADGLYVLPYQVSGVWAYMADQLPEEIAQARLMAYRPSEEEYVDYENWLGVNAEGLFWDLEDRLDGVMPDVD